MGRAIKYNNYSSWYINVWNKWNSNIHQNRGLGKSLLETEFFIFSASFSTNKILKFFPWYIIPTWNDEVDTFDEKINVVWKILKTHFKFNILY